MILMTPQLLFFSDFTLKGSFEFLTVCLAPSPFPRASLLRSLHPCHVHCTNVFIYLFMKEEAPSSAQFGSAIRYYFSTFMVPELRGCLDGEMPRGIIAVHCLQTWLLTRRLLCPTPRILLSQVQCGAQESVFRKSVLRDSDGQSVWGRTYLASVPLQMKILRRREEDGGVSHRPCDLGLKFKLCSCHWADTAYISLLLA